MIATLLIAAGWPFITMRQMDMPEDYTNAVPVFHAMLDVHERHPGAVDEWWFATSQLLEKDRMTEWVRRTIGDFAPHAARAGIAMGFQQGITLGHDGLVTSNQAKREGLYPFSEDARQVDIDGKRTNFLCPTSPEVLEYEEWLSEMAVREASLVSYWLDDDLRMGFWKDRAVGCWCPRCLKRLNETCGTSLTREEFVRRLLSDQETDPIREKWCRFKSEILVDYAAAARRGAKRANPDVRMGYQAISAGQTIVGPDFVPVLAALSDGFRDEVGIRPGNGYYDESVVLFQLPVKLLGVAREAERTRHHKGWRGQIAYEQENYPHYVSQKSPEAIVKEAALALSAGCDALALYWYSGHLKEEPLSYYEQLVGLVGQWRGYFERLAEISKRTRLGGIALRPNPNLLIERNSGLKACLMNVYARRNESEMRLANVGVPVTVAESGTTAFFDAADAPKDSYRFGISDWTALLDRLDGRMPGGLPVRLGRFAHALVLPRVDEANRLVSVTLCNFMIGKIQDMTIRLRRPIGKDVRLLRPDRPDVRLSARAISPEEIEVVLPDLAAWEVCTLVVD